MALFDSGSLTKPSLKPSGMADLQAKQAIGGATASQVAKAGPGMAQQLGAQKAAQESQEVVQKTTQQNQVKQQRGQISINKFATQQRAKMAKRSGNARRTAMEARQRISSMGRDLEQKLFDDRMQFEYDARGVRFANERQLADFKRMVAKDDEEYANFAQQMQNRSTEKRKLLQISQAKITQALTQLSKSRESAKNHELKLKLTRAKQALDNKIKAEAAKAKNRAMVFQGVGMVAGGIAGGFAGNPVLGAQLGGAAGTGVAAMTSK